MPSDVQDYNASVAGNYCSIFIFALFCLFFSYFIYILKKYMTTLTGSSHSESF